MGKPKPKCTFVIKLDSGRKYKIDLYKKYFWSSRRLFDIKFTDETGETKIGQGTISQLVDRIRRLLVKELR